MHRGHHLLVALRPGNLENLRVPIEDLLWLRTQAPGHDDLAVLGERLADGVQGFVHGRIDEAAGIDDHEIGLAVGSRQPRTLRPANG